MKAITIRLPDVEAAMLQDLKKTNSEFRNLDIWLRLQIQEAYAIAYKR